MSDKNHSCKILKVDFAEKYVRGNKNEENKSAYLVQINVLKDGEWVGDFFVDFVEGPLRLGDENERVFVADWSDVKNGNGKYFNEENQPNPENPPFWPVEVAAERLDDRGHVEFDAVHEHHGFKSINSGPNDK